MKIFSSILIAAFLFTGVAVIAQSTEKLTINPGDPTFRMKYENVDFHGKFSVQVLSDSTNNYYLVDFSKFRDKYEKVFFMSLIFQEGKVVDLDGDFTHDKIWFLSDLKYSIKEINGLFQDLKDKVIKNSDMLSDVQKAEWLRTNDKYK